LSAPNAGESGANVTEALEQQKHFRIGDLIAGFIGATILANIGMGIAAEAGGDTFAVFAAGMCGLWLGLLASVLWAAHRRASGSLAVDMWLVVQRGDILRGLAIGIACQLLLIQLIYWALGLFVNTNDVADDLIDKYGQGWHIYPLMLGLVFVAPVIEELFYRGQLLRTLSLRISPWMATLISALVFAALHFQPVELLGLFSFGVVLAEMVKRTQRLGCAVFAHIGFNAAAFAIVFLP
jgi:membrane protease YdiL (CAAX protease family)